MAVSIDGILAYGFDLGGIGSKWQLKGVGECEWWRPSWATPEELEAIEVTDYFDYEAAIADRLAAAGLELEVTAYGMLTSEDAKGIMLTACAFTSAGARVTALHLGDLDARRDIERWDEALLKALEVLDIRPWQPHPMWLLTQSYG